MAKPQLPGMSTLQFSQGDQFATPEQSRKRLEGFADSYISSIMELPMAGMESISPGSGYTPGELRSSPQDILKGQRYAWDEYRQQQAQNPDYASGEQVGTMTGMAFDPFMDVPLGLAAKAAPAISRLTKADVSPSNIFGGMRQALSGERGAVGDVAEEAARLQRARDLGFDTSETQYHGTGNLGDLEQFRPEFTGKGNDQYGSGFYFTTHPQTASGYASTPSPVGKKVGGSDSPGVVQAYVSLKNPIKVTADEASNIGDIIDLDASQVRKMLDKSDALKRGVDDEDMNPLGDHYDDFWSSGSEDWMLDDMAEKYSGYNVESIEADLFDGDSQAFREALRDVTGYDGIEITFSPSEKHTVAWFPEQIRSINAKFDKSKKKSGELLAAAAPAALALGANIDQ